MSDQSASAATGVQMMIHIVIFSLRSGQLELLLVQADGESQRWSLPGNPIQPRQSLEGTALQEIARLTGRHDAYLEQLYTYGDPERNPTRREVAVVYFALLPVSSHLAPAVTARSVNKDVEKDTWFPVDFIRKWPLTTKVSSPMPYAGCAISWNIRPLVLNSSQRLSP